MKMESIYCETEGGGIPIQEKDLTEIEELEDNSSNDEELSNDIVLKRDCIKALQSMNPIVFVQKLNRVMKNTRACKGFCINDSVDNDENTLLHFAVEIGFIEAVQMISEQSLVDLDARENINGLNALQLASKLGLGLMVNAILLHPLRLEENEKYFFDLLAVRRSLELVRSGTDPRNRHHENSIHLAVKSGDLDTVKRLLDAANIIQTLWLTNLSRRPSVIEKAGTPGIKEFSVSGDKTEAAIIASEKDADGLTPLHIAVLNKDYGVHPNRQTDARGYTAYQLAFKMHLDNHEMHDVLNKYMKNCKDFAEESNSRNHGSCLVTATRLRQQRKFGHLKRDALKTYTHQKFHSTAHHRSLQGKSLNQDQAISSLKISRLSLSARLEEHGENSNTKHQGIRSSTHTHRRKKSLPKSKEKENLMIFNNERDDFIKSIKSLSSPRRHETSSSDNEYLEGPISLKRENPLRPPSVAKRPTGPLLRPSVIDPVPMNVQKLPPPPLKPSQIPDQPMPPKPISMSSIRKASCLDPHEYYPMAAARRGICLIINNMQYWHPKFTDRNGCDKDEKRLEQVFRGFGFLVKLLRNLSSQEMSSQLNHLGLNTDHSGYDCFVACIMTHGGLGKLYGIHGDAFPVHELTSPFTADKCPSLAGKPKLFFIQACRGEEYHQGFPVDSPDEEMQHVKEDSDSDINPLEIVACSTDSAQIIVSEHKNSSPVVKAANLPRNHRLIPIYADFLLSYATVAGYRAQRDPKKGSIYIQTLCKRLEKEGKVRGLLDIVTSVHREVSEFVFREIDLKIQNAQIFQQMPEARHTLTRRVQFV